MKLKVTNSISIDSEELEESFVRSGGAGGQNVNKVASAVQLRFDVKGSASLPMMVRENILNNGDARLTKDGVLVIFSDRHRSQDMNRKDVRERLFDIIRQAAIVPKKRIATRPSLNSKKKRLDGKTKRGRLKKYRAGKIELD